jgi:hypothetical protein
VGFIPNNPESHQYYPIYIPNPKYRREGDNNKMMVAKYIQYNPHYTIVLGCNGRGYPQCSLLVTIRWQAHISQPMKKVEWWELQCGSLQEFMVNEALANMGDHWVVGVVNRLRGKMDIDTSLETMLQDAWHMVDKLTKEHRLNQLELIEIQQDIERANLYALIQDQYQWLFNYYPTQPSPKPTPLAPQHRGLAVMLILMDGHPQQVHCHKC